MALVSTLLFYAVATRYLAHVDVGEPHAILYLALAWLSHFALPALVLALPQILIALAVPSRWVLPPLAVVALATANTSLLLDTEIYARYRFHFNGFLWKLLTGPGTGENLPLSRASWLSAAGVVIALLALSAGAVAIALRGASHRRLGRMPACLLAAWTLAFFTAQTMHAWYEAHYDPEVTGVTRHFPAFRPATAKRWLAARGWVEPSSARRVAFEAPGEGNADLVYPTRALECETPKNAPSVLVVIVDALRADVFDGETMPRLRALVRRPNAQYFTEHVSGGNATLGGIFSLFMGIPATYWDGFAAAHRGSAWIDAHRQAGYRIGIFSSATLLSPAFDRTVFASVPDLRLSSEGDGSIERDLDALADLRAFLDAGDPERPFFGVLFLDAAHGASVPPGAERFLPQWERVDHFELDADFDPLPYVNRYRNALHWLDRQIGDLLATAERAGHLDDTLVILTSDHGEEFNDLGLNYWGHGSNFSRYQTHVPLVMLWPGRARRTIHYRTSHYDVAPTIMADVLGCTNPSAEHSIGAHLFDVSTPRRWIPVVSYHNYAILLEDRIVATWPGGGYEVLGPDNRPTEERSVPADIAIEVVDALSRFYR